LSIRKRAAEEEHAKIEKRVKELNTTFYPPAPPVLDIPPARVQDDFPDYKPQPIVRPKKQVGRNDPCPCGSGKKFKKCCLNKR
jgi:uncharacterized protein YecA (UPF0149 family)